MPQRRDNAGAVCNSGMGMLFLCIYLFYLISLILYFYFSIQNFIFLIFVLCWQLQCWHSCRYFDFILISFWFHFPLLHFSFLISFSVTSMSMWTLMPIFCFNLNFILISNSCTSFFYFYFLFNNIIQFYVCAVSRTAMSTLMPIFYLTFI